MHTAYNTASLPDKCYFSNCHQKALFLRLPLTNSVQKVFFGGNFKKINISFLHCHAEYLIMISQRVVSSQFKVNTQSLKACFNSNCCRTLIMYSENQAHSANTVPLCDIFSLLHTQSKLRFR